MCACCDPLWHECAVFCDRPFAVTLSLVFLFLCAPALALLGLAAGASSECPAGSMAPTWAFVFGGVCLVSFGVAVYVFCKFNEPYDLNNPKDRSYAARMGRLMCEDPVIALYICVLIFKFVWLIMGVAWSPTGCPSGFVTMYHLMEIFGAIFFGCGGVYIAAQLCWVTCCPEAANRSAQRVGQRQQARGQRSAGYQGAPTGVVRVPQQQQQPIQVVQHQIPVAQAQPVYHQQRVTAPQVVIHGSQGAGKQSQPEPTAAQRGATAAKSLISGAKGLFGRR
jgi:hypothetical protein